MRSDNISPADSSPTKQLNDFAQYWDLVKQSLYLDALRQAEKEFGPYQNWELPELRFIAACCVNHLGNNRASNAIIWRLARSGFEQPRFISYYLTTVFNRAGVLAAWEASKRYDESTLDAFEAASLLCQRADISSYFRDFRQAEEFLQAAKRCDDSRLVELQGIHLLYLQDQYQPALEQTLALVKKEPEYRSAIQLAALLFQLTGDPEAAMTRLHQPAFKMQSVPMMQQLVGLYVEATDYEQAAGCIDRIESLLIDDCDESTRLLHQLKSDLLCAQQRYGEAVPYLEILSPYHRRISSTLQAKAGGSQGRNILDIPFIRQNHMTCAPASIAMVTAFLGRPVEQDVIAGDITYDGTGAFEERRWLTQHGWYPIEFELTYKAVKALIDAGMPILLSTVEPGSAHLQVLAGYDENIDVLILRDPHHPRLQEFLAQESIDYYAADGPRCMVLADEKSLPMLGEIDLPARELYDHFYRFKDALEKNDRDTARREVSAMSERAASHRLTLQAKRWLAIYDQDEMRVLKTTDTLLDKFPDDVNLQLSKIRSLSYLHSEQRKMEYLEALYRRPDCHYLIECRLAEELRFDDRQIKRSAKLLHRLLRQNSLHAPTLCNYASLLWTQGEFKRSYEIYRFVICLEDKNEGYADSYFKAARYCQDTENSLDFLQDRFERFKNKSSGPAISLFHALDSLHQTRKGLEVLDDAIEALPKDGELLVFAAKEHLYNGNKSKSDSLMAKAEPLVKRTRFLELLAQHSESQQNRDKAIECWTEIQTIEPLNLNAVNNLVRLFLEKGDMDAARDRLESQLLRNPDNYYLLRLKTDWADYQDIDTQEYCYRHLIDHHPDQTWAYLRLCRLYLQKFEYTAALNAVNEAVNRQPNNAQTQCVLGHAYAASAENAAARAAYRRAIELSCDCIEAYRPLLDLALDNEGQAGELEFIYQQLLQQVTYGDAILEFQKLANDWLSADEVLRILKEANQARPDLLHTWLALAIQFRERDLLDNALVVLDRAIEQFPLIPRLYFEEAEIFRLQGDLTKAEGRLREVLDLSPGWAAAGTKLADVLEAQGNYEAAVESLEYLIHATPTAASPHGYLASLYWRLGNQEPAIAAIRKAIEIEPEYAWAWDCFLEWCRKTDRINEFNEELHSLRKSMPANASLAMTHANSLEDPAESMKVLQEYLRMHPQNVDICVEYVNKLVHQQRFTDALDICSDARWGNKVPLVMRANRAWILWTQGHAKPAIDAMQEVVASNPNYYNGWRLLTIWYSNKGESERVIECTNQCLRLFPNDPSVLCFVAEKFLQHDSEAQQQIDTLLNRAYYLDPTDQYRGLTLIDHLLDKNRLPQAEKTLAMLERHVENAFTTYRRMNLACLRDESQRALQYWQKIITDAETPTDLAWSSWKLMQKFKLTEPAGAIIKQQRESGSYLAPVTGECLAYYVIEGRGTKALLKQLKTLPAEPTAFEQRIIEGYIRALIHQDVDIPRSAVKKLRLAIQADTLNWGLIAYLKSQHGEFDFVVDWMQDSVAKAGIEAWMLYFYSIALRHTGDWNQGVEMTRVALAMEHDQYFDDLVVWHSLDLSLQGNLGERNLFSQIDPENLSPISHYVYTLVTCLIKLGDRSFVDAYEDLLPSLEQLKTVAHEGYGNRVAKEARNKTYFHLKQTIDLPLLKSLIWKHRLRRHF